MDIINIDEKYPNLENVIKLGDANRKTLGFLSEGTFRKFATKKQILVAQDNKKNCCGYLLYNINQKGKFVSIVHLCVEPSNRQKGVAKVLVDYFKKITRDSFQGIRIHCRRDYKVNEVWPKFGFFAVDDKKGRSKQGSTLTVWWFDHGHPTLFTLVDEQKIGSKLPVVIDANIFYDLQKSPQSASEKESHSLLAEWLNVKLYLTTEIYNEINRHENGIERKRGRKFIGKFEVLPNPDDEFQKTGEQLRHFFSKKKMSDSDESDLRQLAHSIAANVPFFVTRDEALQKKSEKIYQNYGIQIISPSYLITYQDELMREIEYQPVKLAGKINFKRVHSEQLVLLEKQFDALQWKTK